MVFRIYMIIGPRSIWEYYHSIQLHGWENITNVGSMIQCEKFRFGKSSIASVFILYLSFQR